MEKTEKVLKEIKSNIFTVCMRGNSLIRTMNVVQHSTQLTSSSSFFIIIVINYYYKKKNMKVEK